MATLFQISEPGEAPVPHGHRRAIGIDLGTTNSLVATVRNGYAVHVAIGGGYTTRLTLVNPASIQQQLQLTLNGKTVQRTIPAHGRLDESLGQMFDISGGAQTTGYLKLQTTDVPGVIAYVEIAAFDGLLKLHLNASPKALVDLSCPSSLNST